LRLFAPDALQLLVHGPSRVIASSAPNGSSISRNDGSCTSARQMPTRCCIPPGELGGIFALESGEARPSRSAGRAPPPSNARANRASGSRPATIHVLQHRAPGQQHRRLEHHAELAARAAQALALQSRPLAGRALENAGENLEQRGLAAIRFGPTMLMNSAARISRLISLSAWDVVAVLCCGRSSPGP